MRKVATHYKNFPGWRTMTGAERYNARMHRIFSEAMALRAKADALTYEIVADTPRTFGLRNKATGQIDHGGFASTAMIREFWELHFSQRDGYRLISD